MIFDEFHNALRGRSRDVEAVLAFLRRIGCQYDISPVDRRGRRLRFHQRDRRNGSRFDLLAVPRWQYGRNSSRCSTVSKRRCLSLVLPIFQMNRWRE
ncbi:TniB family NTP-binding protein [Mesorhizobium sp.]|uniref:TniB family NTP-binding protein n=1 Tax=Mesorhizobium sp. TaxID=1871066 RepID=UPI003436728A